MTWPVALLLGFAALFALAYVVSICGMLGLALCDAARDGLRTLRRVL